jgi:farnesyl diphosphate synthase
MSITREQFEEIFPQLVQDLTNHAVQYNLPEKALVWFRNVRPLSLIQHPAL